MLRINNQEYRIPQIASFDVDAQKGFTPLCPDELPIPDGDKIVTALNAQNEYALYRIGSKDNHPENAAWEPKEGFPPFTKLLLPNVDMVWKRHCVVGTIGNELLDGLPNECIYNYFVWKGNEMDMHPYGACFHDLRENQSTGVIEYLNTRGVQVIIVGGLALDYCVKTTALQLRKYILPSRHVIVNLSACRGLTQDSSKAAILEMRAAGIQVVDNMAQVK